MLQYLLQQAVFSHFLPVLLGKLNSVSFFRKVYRSFRESEICVSCENYVTISTILPVSLFRGKVSGSEW
jgi:hypothetical protein